MVSGTLIFALIYLAILCGTYAWYYYAGQNTARMNSSEMEYLKTTTKTAVAQSLRRRGIPVPESSELESEGAPEGEFFPVPWWYGARLAGSIIFFLLFLGGSFLLFGIFYEDIMLDFYRIFYNFPPSDTVFVPYVFVVLLANLGTLFGITMLGACLLFEILERII